ncbi:MAG TPA: hypothetical protein VFG30_44220 [Polyangiales bacterium]|jgi:hypothetical protein|nr:hypothetical protein [Polyangiales bacterium]
MPAMPKKTTKPTPTKSDVIRSMPNASATDIIKKARSLGLKLTANHVYAVRAIDKRRGKPGRLSKGGAAPMQSSKPRNPSSKTAFIRGFTSDTPAAKVVDAGKKAGIKLSKEYVYRVRALAKPQNGGGGRRSFGRIPAAAIGATTGEEQRFATLAMEIGLVRATALLQRVRQKLLE